MLQIVELDPKTKALQIRSSINDQDVVLMGSIANAHLFLRYKERSYIGYSHWNPDMYEGGVMVGERVCGTALHQMLEFICEGKNLSGRELEAYFDEFVVDDQHIKLRVWIRTPYNVFAYVYHVKRLDFYALPEALFAAV